MRPRYTSAGWFLTGLFALVLLPRPAAPQFTSFSHDSRNILEGSWQSCRESDGRYSERVYDHIVNAVGLFEVHLGPRREQTCERRTQGLHRVAPAVRTQRVVVGVQLIEPQHILLTIVGVEDHGTP